MVQEWGFLTKYLLESEAQINVIEIDRDSVAYLNNDFKNEHVNLDTTNAKFKIIEGDFLKQGYFKKEMTVRAKKHLGQHFLNDEDTAKNIANSLSGGLDMILF